MHFASDHQYSGTTIISPIKPAKSLAVAPPFWNHVKASVVEFVIDTDGLGTFSGELKARAMRMTSRGGLARGRC